MVHQHSLSVYYEKIKPGIKQKHLRITDVISKLQPCTSLDVADFLNVPLNSISGRFSELPGRSGNDYLKPVIEECGNTLNRYRNTCALYRIKEYSEDLKQAELFT